MATIPPWLMPILARLASDGAGRRSVIHLLPAQLMGADPPAQSGELYVCMIPYSPKELAQRPSHPPCSPNSTTGTNATMDQWSMQDLNDCEPTPAGHPCHKKFARFLALQDWQAGGNGFVTLNGYTARWGNPRLDGSCTSVSVDCVLLDLEHAPVGYAASRMDDGCKCVVYEHDIYFNGKPSDWIKFPN